MYLNDIEEEVVNERAQSIDYSDDDDDEEEEEYRSSRASTIVKVLRLERSVKQINQKLSLIDTLEKPSNDKNYDSDIKDLKNEISSLKEEIETLKAQLQEAQKPNLKEEEEIEEKADSKDVLELTSRVLENEKKIDALTSKHVDGFQAQVSSVSTKISFVLFLIMCVGFLIHAYYVIGSKNAKSENLETIKIMDDTTLKAMMLVCYVSFIPLLASILGLFFGKGKRGKAFAGIILSAITILIYGILKYTNVFSI